MPRRWKSSSYRNALSDRDLLEFFFQIHDPTTLNRQGSEHGRSVRSAIFYTSEEQRLTALDTIVDVDASGLWPGNVVTEVVAAGPFWGLRRTTRITCRSIQMASRATSFVPVLDVEMLTRPLLFKAARAFLSISVVFFGP